MGVQQKRKARNLQKLTRFYYICTKYYLSTEFKGKRFSDPKIIGPFVGRLSLKLPLDRVHFPISIMLEDLKALLHPDVACV